MHDFSQHPIQCSLSTAILSTPNSFRMLCFPCFSFPLQTTAISCICTIIFLHIHTITYLTFSLLQQTECTSKNIFFAPYLLKHQILIKIKITQVELSNQTVRNSMDLSGIISQSITVPEIILLVRHCRIALFRIPYKDTHVLYG